jgi:hypothetical protein
LRFWDGQRWTDSRAPASSQSGLSRNTWTTIVVLLVILVAIAVFALNDNNLWETDAWKQCVAQQESQLPNATSSTKDAIEKQCHDQYG